MPVDEWLDISIQFNDLAHRLSAGHRIRLAVSTSYWPMVWPSPKPVALTVATGDSNLSLPVRQQRDEDGTPEFGPPEMAPQAKSTVIVPSQSGRTVERDLASGEWREQLIEDGGLFHIEAIDLDVGDGMTCDFTIQEDDPLSADGVWQWRSTRQRDDWDIEISTETRLRATETEWLCDTDIDAKENGITVFSRAWRERIPRDGV